MAPCCRLYGWLGVKLAERREEKEQEEKEKAKAGTKNPFAAWIETYSSFEYHAATAKLEGLLDRLAEGLSVEERGEFFFHFFSLVETSGGGTSFFLGIESNDALAACCCRFFSEREQKQQQRIAEKLQHAPGVCSQRPHTKGKRRRGKGIGVVVAVAVVAG